MCWVDREGGGFWAVTTHPEVSSIGADPVGFCSSRGILIDEIGTTYDNPPTMMHTDPPQHTRYRRLVQPGLQAVDGAPDGGGGDGEGEGADRAD